MKKVLYTCLVGLLVSITINVNASTHSYEDWQTADGVYGTKQQISDNVTIVTGKYNEGFGQVTGPYSKASKAKLVDGIVEEVNIKLDLDEISNDKFFEATVSLNEDEGSAEELTEKIVMTQKVGNVLKVTAGWYDGNTIGEIKESGLYTYQWHYYIENGKAYINFSILHYGEIVVTTNAVEVSEINVHTMPNVQVRSVWLNNIQTDNGLELYTNLPGLDVETKGEEVAIEDENFNDVINESLKNDDNFKELFDQDGDITVELIAKEAVVDAEEEKLFEDALTEGNIGGYLDIEILVIKDDQEEGKLTELSKTIQLSAKLPEMPAIADGFSRKYYILREHNGVIEKLDATLSEDGKSLLFASDKFSKYAIVYVDSKVEEQQPTESVKPTETEPNPNTYDASMSYMGLALFSLGTIIVSIRKLRNN